ncbi:T9SS type A sorting domain-containing protein, partial [candidate division KSB1 bacterium]|nr:T9SS type A sorting domain-containing protein [candidate division KSB1 bacterium]
CDPDGNVLWVKQGGLTSDKYDQGIGVAVDGYNNILATGYFEEKAKFDADTLVSQGDRDLFVVKYDPNGNMVWVTRAGGSGSEEGFDIAADDWGNAYVTGYFNGSCQFGPYSFSSIGREIFTAKFMADGTLQWVQRIFGTDNKWNEGLGITAEANGSGCYVTGHFEATSVFDTQTLTSRGGRDIFIAKYDAGGTLQWVEQAGGEDWDEGHKITKDPAGNLYTTGYFTKTAAIGTQTVTTGGGRDVFVYKKVAAANQITFLVTVPPTTPPDAVIYITGNFNSWDPGPGAQGGDGQDHDLPLTKVGGNQWQITLPFDIGQPLEYIYTRGNWETKEVIDPDDLMANRKLTAPGGNTTQNDLVISWYDRQGEMAASFDGDGDYIDLGNQGVRNITDAITLECWVRHHSGEPNLYEDIVMKGNQTYGFQFDRDNQCFVFHLVEADGADFKAWRNCNSGVKPQAGQWYHLAGTFNGSVQKVYINGILRNTCEWQGKILSRVQESLTVAQQVANDNRWGNLDIDDLRVWNRARTMEEIVSQMYQALTGKEEGLIGYWPFDGDLRDRSNNGSDGVAYGNTYLYPSPLPPLTPVTFQVTIPFNTPQEDDIYLAGNFNYWDPGPDGSGESNMGFDLKMNRMAAYSRQLTLPYTAGETIEYKYTRGSWNKVETYPSGDGIPNRTLTIPPQSAIQSDLVQSWSDFPPTGPWAVQTSGVTSTLVCVDAVSQSTGWIAGQNGTILRTWDSGNTWVNVAGDLDTLHFSSIASTGAQTALVAGWHNVTPQTYHAYIFKTVNGGATWKKVFEQPGGFLDYIGIFGYTTAIAVGDPVDGRWTVVKSIDGGDTWTLMQTAPTADGNEYSYPSAVFWDPVNNGWIGTSKSHAYHTTDGGETWTTVHVNPAYPRVNTLAFQPPGTGLFGTGADNRIIRTLDGGFTWTEASVPGEGTVYYLGYFDWRFWLLHNQQIYTSSNKGDTWHSSFSATHPLRHLSLACFLDRTCGWAVGTDGVILRYDAPPVKVETNRQESMLSDFALLQNYPNPFNLETIITYHLPQDAEVSLTVYGMSGQVVRHLYRGKQAAGTHSLAWDGCDQTGRPAASGLYFCRLQGRDENGKVTNLIQKMILAK